MTGSTCFVVDPMSTHTFKDESAAFGRQPQGEGSQGKRRSLGPGSDTTSPTSHRGKVVKRKSTAKSTPSPDPDAASSHVPTLRFVTTTDPTQFKDRSTMRGNRSHVMYNHLKQRQQRSPSASPSEPPRSSRSGKGKEPRPSHEQSPSGYSESLEVPSSGDSYTSFFPEESGSHPHSPQSFVLSPLSENYVEQWNPAAFEQPSSANYYSASFAMGMPSDSQPLVQPRRLSSTPNMVDMAFQTYAPFKPISGSTIEPFRTLPPVDVELMKYHYNSLFGTSGMEGHWIPTLVGTRVAFMSSICFVAVHMDAISSAPAESYEAAAAKLEVVHLINESMGNPNHVASNPIIVAAVHLTLAELVNMEDAVASSHCGGIERMIRIRGGLHTLGMEGQLAGVATTASFLAAILRETQPNSIYNTYLSNLQRQSGSPVDPIPESPLYCPRADFYTLIRSRGCQRHTFELLSDLRNLTDLFIATEQYASNDPTQHSYQGEEYEDARERNAMQGLRLASRILGLPSATDPNAAGQPCYGDWAYEACRLAALVYVHALTARTPLSASTNTAAAASISTSGAMLLLALRDALVRSDVSDCWGDMAGVLLWASLVGAVAARGVVEPDMLATRRWMSALAIRCTLLLTFEHPVPLLGSLRKMLDVIGFCAATSTSGANTSASEESASVEHYDLSQGL